MRTRITRWLVGAALALALAIELLAGGASAPVVYGADPTPTALPTNGNPGGHGGGG